MSFYFLCEIIFLSFIVVKSLNKLPKIFVKNCDFMLIFVYFRYLVIILQLYSDQESNYFKISRVQKLYVYSANKLKNKKKSTNDSSFEMILFNFRSVMLIFINAKVAQMIMNNNRKNIISIILEDTDHFVVVVNMWKSS